MIYTTDDVCPSNLEHWKWWDKAKVRKPDLRVLAFTIANKNGNENVLEYEEFREWFEERKGWVTIGIHGYDHTFPPECERENAEEYIQMSLNILEPFLSERFLYRPPGHQRTTKTIGILKRLGVAGIAFATSIWWFDSGEREYNIMNTHCTYNKFENPIGQVWEMIK